MNRQVRLALGWLGLLTLAFARGGAAHSPEAAGPAFPAIEGGLVLEHTKLLASDAFEGRAPGTNGETLTVQYISEQLRKLGIKPGNPDGTYLQKVPLVGTTVQESPTLTFRKGDTMRRLAWRDDYVAWTKRFADRVSSALTRP